MATMRQTIGDEEPLHCFWPLPFFRRLRAFSRMACSHNCDIGRPAIADASRKRATVFTPSVNVARVLFAMTVYYRRWYIVITRLRFLVGRQKLLLGNLRARAYLTGRVNVVL